MPAVRLAGATRACRTAATGALDGHAVHSPARKRSGNGRIRAMERVSIQDLKADLSGAISRAESGDTIVITRHKTPVAQLGPARFPFVHQGRRAGAARLRPAVKPGRHGRALAILLEDRGTR